MAKKIKVSAKKIQNSTEIIQKITNRVDWNLSKRVCDVITIDAAIAQAIPHVIEHMTESKKNEKPALSNCFQVMAL